MKYILLVIGILITISIPARASDAEMIVMPAVDLLSYTQKTTKVEIKVVKSKDELEQEAKAEKARKASFVVKRTPREVIPRSDYSSCVLYVEHVTGVNPGVIGIARNFPINSHTPKIDSILISNESRAGHASLVVDIKGGNLILDEANYIRGKHTTGRKLPINSPLIIGFYNR